MSASQKLAATRVFFEYSAWDPRIVNTLLPEIIDMAGALTMSQKKAFSRLIGAVLEIFSLKKIAMFISHVDAGFMWRRITAMRIAMYRKSLLYFPDDGATLYNLALAYFYDKKWDKAAIYFEKNLSLRPEHKKSKEFLFQIEMRNQ